MPFVRIDSPPLSKKRACGFCSLGVFSTLLVLVVLGFAGWKMLDRRGLRIGLVAKDEDVVFEDDTELPQIANDQDSKWKLPTQPLVDPDTSVPHPALISGKRSDSQVLMGLGAGVRSKLGISIYSVAFYVDPEVARVELARFRGKKQSELREDPEFYAALRLPTFDRAVRLVIKMGVDGSQMSQGLGTSLIPKLKEFAPDRVDELRELLKANLKISRFNAGDVLLFTQSGDNFYISFNDVTNVVPEPALANAFFAIYVDEDTPASKARARFPERVPQLFIENSAGECASGAVLTEVSLSTTVRLEGSSKQNFPLVVNNTEMPANAARSLSLVGVSGRARSFLVLLSSSVYGVGLYVDLPAWNSLIRLASPSRSETVFSKFELATNITRAIRVHMSANVQSSDVVQAFAKALRPTLSESLDAGQVDEALCLFRNLFTFDMVAGETMHFQCSPDGKLYAMVNDNARPAIPSVFGAPLCAGLIRTYLGSNSVLGGNGREELVQNLPI